MELFFWNFEKYPKISKGGTLGIFLLLDIFLNFWKFSQNIQRGDPHKKFFLMHFWMNWGYKKKCGTGLTPPLMEISILFFFEPFPYLPGTMSHKYIWIMKNALIHNCIVKLIQTLSNFNSDSWWKRQESDSIDSFS